MTGNTPSFNDDATTAEQLAATAEAIRDMVDVEIVVDTRFIGNGNAVFEISCPLDDEVSATIEVVERGELYKFHFVPATTDNRFTSDVDSWEDALIEAYMAHTA